MSLVSRSVLALILALAPAAWAQNAPSSAPAEKMPEGATPTPQGVRDRPARRGLNVEEPEAPEVEPPAQVGVGGRVRFIYMPTAVLNLFLGHSTTMTSAAFGGEVIRRKGNLDIVFGLEYANVSPADGLYLEKGNDPSMSDQYPDSIHFDNFSMLSVDGSFIWHADLTGFMQLRYGAGLGIGFLLGNIKKTKTICNNTTSVDQLDNPQACTPQPATTKDADKPPVVPIVNLLAGLRFKVVDELSINLELGFRDVFFAGGSIGYFF